MFERPKHGVVAWPVYLIKTWHMPTSIEVTLLRGIEPASKLSFSALLLDYV